MKGEFRLKGGEVNWERKLVKQIRERLPSLPGTWESPENETLESFRYQVSPSELHEGLVPTAATS